ncbi:hypothetical protein D1871_21425 [Nakamurella silvestris]|nr:hypothetical protein D1871_21425 [Nakamurella silvestris]
MRRSHSVALVTALLAVVAGLTAGTAAASGSAPAATRAAAETAPAARAAAPGAPFGVLDGGKYTPGGVIVAGWAAYRGTPQRPLKVHVYLDGTLVTQVTADQPRPDVARKFPGVSADTGFRVFLPVGLTAQIHTVCVYAIRAAGAPGKNPQIGCSSFAVPDSPLGGYDLSGLGDRHIHVVGAVADPNTTRPIQVRITLDGRVLNTILANKASFVYEDRAGNRTTQPANGHGFDLAFNLPADTKVHQVCTSALNAPGTPGTDGTTCKSVRSS